MIEEPWFERVMLKYIKTMMSIRERVQLIQKIAELSVQELLILEAEKKAESP